MKPVDPFPRLLHAFFYEWMVQQRNASAHTVRSYRDTWRLFLRFVAQRRRRPIAQLTLSDLTASEVKTFLQYTEQERGDTIGTRNCRLSALRSFFSFVADREPTAIEQCTQILHVPMKKAPIHAPCYLEPEEVKAILAQPDRSTIEGQRDHALFSFLYNTGARIQEALDV
ncbi:integrase, partial [Streptomyces sp. Alain-F2R5]